jgi:hypothetical protein
MSTIQDLIMIFSWPGRENGPSHERFFCYNEN